MKKLILMLVMMIVIFATAVSAQTMVGKYLKIEWKADPVVIEKHAIEKVGVCYDGFVFQQEIQLLNENEIFNDLLNTYEDGFYVLHLTHATYMDTEYFTAHKMEGTVNWIKKGFCVGKNEDYVLYSTDIDIAAEENKIYNKYQAGTLNAMKTGYDLLNRINGLDVYDKFKITSAATKYAAAYTLFPGGNYNEQ
jgi:hypothetical protein